LIAIALVLAAGLALSLYMTHKKGLTQIHTPADYGLDFEGVTFHASEGLALHGWWIPAADSDRAVIILYGHDGSMDWDVHRARACMRPG
jgi:hypothetical protein